MKHMKTITALLLAFALLSAACAACAEELPYMQQLSQDRYINALFLTPESYPEVCISPNYFGSMYFTGDSDPIFIHFPCPPDTYATDFDIGSCSFVNTDYGYQYFYNVHGNNTFETFLDDAEADEYILADGSDGVAIYLDPDSSRAYALIDAGEPGNGAMVELVIYGGSNPGKGDQQIIDGLTSLVTDETQRITSSMSVDMMENYWTQGRYAGIKMLSAVENSNAMILTYTPSDNNVIYGVNGSTLYTADLERKLTVSLSLNTYTYVNTMEEDEPEHVSTVEIGGETYRIYYDWMDDKYIYTAYVASTIVENAGYNSDQPLYLALQLSPTDNWASEDAVIQDLEKVVSGVQIDFDQTYPDYHDFEGYPATTEVEANAGAGDAPAVGDTAQGSVDVPVPAEAWTCSNCGSENIGGKFCPNCGAARPEQLVCSNCGYVVPEGQSPNFCPECGNPF